MKEYYEDRSVCLKLYITCAHVSVPTCIHTYVCIYIYIHMHTKKNIYIYVNIHVYVDIHAGSYILVCRCVHVS